MPTLPNLQKVSITFSTFTSRDSDTILHVFIKNRSSDTSWVDGATDFISNQLAYDDFVSQGIFCRNPYLAVFEAVAEGVGFPAGSLSQEYFLDLRSNDISCGEIVLPVVNIHILPNGNNTWQFNYIVKFYFADPAYDFSFSSIEMGVPGVSLSEANRNYVGIGNENPNAVVAPVNESGMDFTLTQVTLDFNTESGAKMAGTKLNVQLVNRISSNNAPAIGSVADLFSDMEVGTAAQAFSNSLTPANGLASPLIGLQAMVLPLVSISIDPPNAQQGAWIFDLRVQYYFGTEAYPRALMFESTTSGIYLDSTYTGYNCVYMGDSFPTVAPAAAPLAQLSPYDITKTKPIPFSLLEKKLAEFINNRQGLDPSSPSPAIARIRLDNQGKFSQASTTPANYYDFQIIEANPLTPGALPAPNYSEAVTWNHSPTDLGVGAYETYFSNFNSQSINLTFDPTQITPFTLTIVFDTSGSGSQITTSAPVVGGTYTPTEFSITIKLTLTVAPHPIYPDNNRIDFLSWITDLNNLVFSPQGGLTGTFLGQPVALQAPNRAEGIGALLDEGVMLVKLTIPGHTAPGGTIRQNIRDTLWSKLSQRDPITRQSFADTLNSQLNSWLLGGTTDPQDHGALPKANICQVQSVNVNSTTQNIEVKYAGPQFRFEFSSPTGSLQPGSLSNIDHIVVLMMENRSFDHMLGYLSLPPEKGGMGRSDVDGLKGNEVNQLLDGTLCPSFAAQPGDTVFAPDPPHSFEPVGRTIDGGKMDGFAQSTADESGPDAAPNIMKYHTAVNVPTFDALARDFALCHRWFASHPGPTFPNRYYATTGRANIDQYGFWEVSNSATKQPCFTDTIFDYLSEAQVSWTYYEQSYTFLRFFEKYTFDNTHIVDFDDPGLGFLNAAATGNLPSVTFIDPHFIELPPGSDCDGPPADARQGQLFVQQVVEALVTSPNWEKTMLIITYDEHGGFYDHVSPPPAVQIAPGLPANYGVRVPTFVVSPWVAGGSVFGNEGDGATAAAYYDHTSILRTITKRFLSADVPLGPRYAAANDLSSLIQAQPRSSVLLPFIPYNLLFSLSQNRLAVQGASSAPGARLCQLTPDDTSPAQLFSFEDAGGGQFYIRTQNGSLYLTADIAAAGSGSAVALKQDVKYSANSGGNPSSQLWAFVWQPSVIGSGVKLATIHNVAVPGKSLHPAAQSIVSGALVVLETVTSSTIDDPNYLWEIGSPLIPGTEPPITPVKLVPSASPASLTYGLQQVGTESAQQTVTISGNPTFAITALAIVDSNGVADPNFASVPPPGSPPPPGSVNIQNGQLVVTVWFFPTAAGALSATLQISHNQAGSPLMIPLSGTGNPLPLPLLSFSPGSLNFDPKKITNHTVTLTNTGTAPLTIISIVIADSNYSMSNTCNIGADGGTLQPGQQCEVNVICRFTGPGGTSQMVITHDAAGSPAVVELNATSKSGGGGQ